MPHPSKSITTFHPILLSHPNLTPTDILISLSIFFISFLALFPWVWVWRLGSGVGGSGGWVVGLIGVMWVERGGVVGLANQRVVEGAKTDAMRMRMRGRKGEKRLKAVLELVFWWTTLDLIGPTLRSTLNHLEKIFMKFETLGTSPASLSSVGWAGELTLIVLRLGLIYNFQRERVVYPGNERKMGDDKSTQTGLGEVGLGVGLGRLVGIDALDDSGTRMKMRTRRNACRCVRACSTTSSSIDEEAITVDEDEDEQDDAGLTNHILYDESERFCIAEDDWTSSARQSRTSEVLARSNCTGVIEMLDEEGSLRRDDGQMEKDEEGRRGGLGFVGDYFGDCDEEKGYDDGYEEDDEEDGQVDLWDTLPVRTKPKRSGSGILTLPHTNPDHEHAHDRLESQLCADDIPVREDSGKEGVDSHQGSGAGGSCVRRSSVMGDDDVAETRHSGMEQNARPQFEVEHQAGRNKTAGQKDGCILDQNEREDVRSMPILPLRLKPRVRQVSEASNSTSQAKEISKAIQTFRSTVRRPGGFGLDVSLPSPTGRSGLIGSTESSIESISPGQEVLMITNQVEKRDGGIPGHRRNRTIDVRESTGIKLDALLAEPWPSLA